MSSGLDRLLADTDDKKLSQRFTFVKRLSKRAILEDAAGDVDKPSTTGTYRRILLVL